MVTQVATGQSVISCGINGPPIDSIIVASIPAGGAWVGVSTAAFEVDHDSTIGIPIGVDMWSYGPSPLGSLTLQITWDPAQLTYVSSAEYTYATSSSVNVTDVANGHLTVADVVPWGLSYAQLSGPIALTFRAASTAGRTGSIVVTVLQAADAYTFADALPKIVPLTQPIVIR